MAITATMRTEITQLYVALFGRAPDSEGLGFWVTLRNQGQSLTQIANTMYGTAPARAYFPLWMDNGQIIASFYENVLGRAPGTDPEGIAFWTAKLNATGATPGSVITEMIAVVANYTGTDPAGLESQDLFNNRVDVAQYYAENGGDIANATIVLADVTSDAASVDAAMADIDAGTVGATPQALTLTVGQDNMDGSSAGDTFVANVVQNDLGQQVNTLGSGDSLNGGGGSDTLMAKVTAGAFVNGNNNATMPIQPMTSSIETIKLEAVNSGIDGSNTNVYINAKDMLGVDTIGSWHSDANLVIQNMTTQDNSGVGRELSDMTVLMGYTGNSDSNWDESDLSVYFDQDYLNPSTSFTKPSVDIRLMNEDNYDDNPEEPLAGVYVEKLVITLGGGGDGVRSYSLAQYVDELGDVRADGTGAELIDYIKTYDELYDALVIAVELLKEANPGDAALQTLTVTVGDDFFADISPLTGLQRRGESMTLSVDGATNGEANTLVVAAQDLVLDPIATTDIRNSNRFERAEDTPALPSTELSINIELEKVGLAGDGGDLLVGSMFKDGENEWSDLYDGKGIAVFNVTVSGDDSKPSSLASLHSTGNNLREVNVETNAAQTGTFADLTIGNSNTQNLDLPESMELGDVVDPTSRNQGALKDVQTFDASGFKGDLTLYAALTGEVTEKYMTLVDAAPDAPTADNVQFVYTGGTGNDYINLWLSDSNLAKAGTTVREDFNLTINGGAGDDEIVTMIGNGSAGFGEDQELDDNIVDSFWDNWYQNSAINANLNINGDAGNDTIRTLGSGNWVIDGGTGNDTIYADNTGGEDGQGEDSDGVFNDGKATWVLNSVNNNVDDLLSENAASVSAVNAYLTVSFMGYTKEVVIANSQGSLTNVTISDLDINQAIKAAINLDPVLSKLLVAEDGPGRTLIVRSLIDGEMDDGWADYGYNVVGLTNMVDNLSISFSDKALTAAQTSTSLVLFSTAALTTGALLGGYNPGADADFGHQDLGNWVTLTGEDSENVADNEIEGDTGNDVIVLGTGDWSNDTLVYEGLGNGNDSIVNFQDNYTEGGEVWSGGEDEVVSLVFSDSDGSPVAETIIFDGVTVNLAAPTLMGIIPSLDVASQFVNQYNAAAATNGWVAVLGSPAAVAGTATAEVFTATFGATVDADTVTFDGVAVVLTAGQTNLQNAAEFVLDYTAAAGETWSAVNNLDGTVTFTKLVTGVQPDVVTADFVVTSGGAGADIIVTAAAPTTQGTANVMGYSVTLTHDVPGAVADLTAASFTGTYFAASPDPDGNGVVAVTVTTQGTDVTVLGSQSTFTVTYTTATTAVTAAGAAAITNPILVTGDGALTAANDLFTTGVAGYTAGSVVAAADGSSYSVTFTALVNGATAIPADTTFGLGVSPLDGVNGSFTSTLGVADTTTPPVLIVTEPEPVSNFDFIDFSWYDPTGVVVTDTNQAAEVVIGTAGAAAAKWITMTESTTNDGFYTINLVTSTVAGTADDVVQLIGTADFGFEKDFTDFTFII